MTRWSGGLVEWIEGDTAYLSVVFSWQLSKAFQRAAWYKAEGYKVVAGGPAVYYQPNYLRGVADIEHSDTAMVWRHNPDATFTSRGCVKRCCFCIVPAVEGKLVELDNWEVRPIICDNNLLACSDEHFGSVIDRLKPLRGIDFNQGLDASLMTEYHAARLAELNLKAVRLAWDSINHEHFFRRALGYLLGTGISKHKIKVYCLIGYGDTPDDAYHRLQTVKDLGLRPNPMRYQPLNSVRRNQYVDQARWTEWELRHFMRYWSRLRWLEHIPFGEYKYSGFQWSPQ